MDDFNHKCVPESVGLAAIVGMSRNPHAEFIESFIRERPVFTYAELKSAFIAEGMTPPNDKQLPHLIREAGYEKGAPRIEGRGQVRLYYPIGMPINEVRIVFKELEGF